MKDKLNIPCRFRSRQWRDIGQLIFNLSKGNDDGYALFLMYSELDPKHPVEDEIYYYCYEVWSRFFEIRDLKKRALN